MSLKDRNEDGLELEHVLGFNAHMRNTTVLHPVEKGKYLTGSGSAVVYADLFDPHAQKFFGRAMEEAATDMMGSTALRQQSISRPTALGAPQVAESVSMAPSSDIRHDNHVTCLDIAPDGQIAASGQLPSPYSSVRGNALHPTHKVPEFRIICHFFFFFCNRKLNHR